MSGMLKDWSAEHTAKFQKEIMTFRHGLPETNLFSDEALATLLDKHPKHMLDVCTMGCLLYTSPSPRDKRQSRMPSSA